MILTYAAEYCAIFLVLLIFGYVVPAVLFHCLFWGRRAPGSVALRIQQRLPRPGQIRDEVRHSLIALLFFALYSLIIYHLAISGATAIYFDFRSYPWWWAVAGFAIAVILHDVYFYATHRVMHLAPLFKLVHVGHHRSLSPTPWAILSFQPLETVSQFGIYVLLIFFLPLHPATLFAYQMFSGVINAAGHCGHEFVPASSKEHRLLKYLNAVTHHDLHHSHVRCNFGQYFNILDRVFGTFRDRPAV